MIIPIPYQSHSILKTRFTDRCVPAGVKITFGGTVKYGFSFHSLSDPLMLADWEECGIIDRVVMDKYSQGPFMLHEMFLS
jgi:hypothetical protein